jgi:hypothetical protein
VRAQQRQRRLHALLLQIAAQVVMDGGNSIMGMSNHDVHAG